MSEPHYSTTELAAIRTELAYHRNRLAADRTLMSVMRTSLSLISFGFTIFSIFRALAESDLIGHAVPDGAPGRFGLALVLLGVGLLIAGILADRSYMQRLRMRYDQLLKMSALAGIEPMGRSPIMVSAILLLLIGLVAILLILIRL